MTTLAKWSIKDYHHMAGNYQIRQSYTQGMVNLVAFPTIQISIEKLIPGGF